MLQASLPRHAFAPFQCGMLIRPGRASCFKSAIRRSEDLRQSATTSPESELSLLAVVPKVSLGGLALAGATLGPLLDGIHGTVHLLEYKVARIDFAGLHSSLSVPLLLGSYYVVLGALFLVLDSLAQGKTDKGIPALSGLQQFLSKDSNIAATNGIREKLSWPLLALNIGVVALLLYLSAVLYQNDVPYVAIAAVLASCGVLNWQAFDRTRQGLLLSLLSAVAAPLSELVIINVLGLWQYPHPDIFGAGGVPSWVACCYFFYTPAVGNLARLLSK